MSHGLLVIGWCIKVERRRVKEGIPIRQRLFTTVEKYASSLTDLAKSETFHSHRMMSKYYSFQSNQVKYY